MFKKGDIVLCINTSGLYQDSKLTSRRIIEGKIYTVDAVIRDKIVVEEIPSNEYYAVRFKNITTDMSKILYAKTKI
jgi:hypothetical protein